MRHVMKLECIPINILLTILYSTKLSCSAKFRVFHRLADVHKKGMTSLLLECTHAWGRHGLAAAVSRVATKQSAKRESYARLTCDILSPSLQQFNGKTATLQSTGGATT